MLPSSVAPASRCSVTWLFRKSVPERYVPGGKYDRSPAGGAQRSIAFWIASVQSVLPSGTAPKSRTFDNLSAATAARRQQPTEDREHRQLPANTRRLQRHSAMSFLCY